jgi:hypothetical protein
VNRALRTGHRGVWIALALLLPLLLVAALRARQPVPPGAPLEPAPATATGAPVHDVHGLWDQAAIDTRAWRDARGLVLELEPRRDLQRPDVLVYWAAGGPPDRLPDDAHLLGTLAGTQRRQFVLPGNGAARLYLYSLGHQEIVTTGVLPAAPR